MVFLCWISYRGQSCCHWLHCKTEPILTKHSCGSFELACESSKWSVWTGRHKQLQTVKLNLICDYCVCTHVWVHMIPCAIDAHVEVRSWLCGVSFTFMWDFRVGYFIWFILSVTLSFREQPFLEYLKKCFFSLCWLWFLSTCPLKAQGKFCGGWGTILTKLPVLWLGCMRELSRSFQMHSIVVQCCFFFWYSKSSSYSITCICSSSLFRDQLESVTICRLSREISIAPLLDCDMIIIKVISEGWLKPLPFLLANQVLLTLQIKTTSQLKEGWCIMAWGSAEFWQNSLIFRC